GRTHPNLQRSHVGVRQRPSGVARAGRLELVQRDLPLDHVAAVRHLHREDEAVGPVQGGGARPDEQRRREHRRSDHALAGEELLHVVCDLVDRRALLVPDRRQMPGKHQRRGAEPGVVPTDYGHRRLARQRVFRQHEPRVDEVDRAVAVPVLEYDPGLEQLRQGKGARLGRRGATDAASTDEDDDEDGDCFHDATYLTYPTRLTYPPSLALLVRRELRRARPTHATHPTYVTHPTYPTHLTYVTYPTSMVRVRIGAARQTLPAATAR